VMLNKKLVLGSLAGATLLVGAAIMVPTVANAAVSGTCVNCHTMHNSQDDATVYSGTTNFLLNQNCAGCHTGFANDGNGVSGTTPFAPQVGAAASSTQNAGGYFQDIDGKAHNVNGSITSLTASALTQSPGGAFDATGTNFICESCHGATGAHHSVPTSYRMLRADKNGDGTIDGVTVTPGATVDATYGISGTGSTYNEEAMNYFCADCHGTFHGDTNTAGPSSPFTRHPTANATSPVDANSYNSYATTAAVPVGELSSGVMCISCHRAHGSDNADLLRFSYAEQNAGTTQGDSLGCESCHGAK
jgi:hypothetical protein